MLFDYVAPGVQAGRMAMVWSQFPLQPLASGVLTPLSHSVLAELAGRSWYAHYDRLGFSPTPRSRVVRRHKGRAYFNLSLSAQLEAEQAGVEPPMLQVNQQQQHLAAWEKPGFLAGFKFGRAQKKIDEALAEYGSRLAAITERSHLWYIKTHEVRWSQAEVLQIMEEIEPIGSESMAAYLAARAGLERLYAQLVNDMEGQLTTAHALLLINNALCDIQGLVESAIAEGLLQVAEALREPEHLAWLKAGNFADWRGSLPGKQAQDRMAEFMAAFGHRAMHEGEMAQPRWQEDPGMVMRGLLTHIEHPRKHPNKLPSSGNLQKLLDNLSPQARKQGPQLVQKLRDLHKLQSGALHALAYIWGGTRRWALAAAKEAMVDGRVLAADDIFYFELEEVKQMMTGEWNVSSRDEIHATAVARRAQHAAWQTENAPEILLGDQEGRVTHHGLPGVAGHAVGPLRRWGTTKKNGCSGAIVGAEALDSGYALALPLADGFVAAGGTPLDPFVVAARAWHHPVIVNLGQTYDDLIEGAHTTLDATPESVHVTQ